jgi:GTPase Era involved in 16S rRNA processing
MSLALRSRCCGISTSWIPPGTNAINRAHERLTVDFVPRADLVLFVTSADRPFTETERLFLESIRNLCKKIVLVFNKIDIYETSAISRRSCSSSANPTCVSSVSSRKYFLVSEPPQFFLHLEKGQPA